MPAFNPTVSRRVQALGLKWRSLPHSMAVLNKRPRTVSFRVSEEEYEILLGLSAQHGAHSVSEFARTLAFLSPGLNSPVAEVKAQAQILDLRARFQELTQEVHELRDRVEKGLGRAVTTG